MPLRRPVGLQVTDLSQQLPLKAMPPDQGADTPVFLAVGDLKGQTGQFWRDRIAEDW